MVDYTDTSVSNLIVNKLTYAKYIELKNAGTLQADQLYQITDPESMSGSTSWGAITGTLSNQTDLNNALSGKQATLVSGTNIKTVNSTSLLGSGNIAVQATITGGATTITSNNLTVSRALISNSSGKVAVSDTSSTELGYVKGVTSAIQTQINAKQATLVSGTNIKTVNSTSLLGSGNISITGLPSQSGQSGKYLTTNGTSASWGSVSTGSVPVGTIIPYGGSSAPSGYLLCDGSAVSRTTYSALYAVIGTAYGSGDGNSTFNLPISRQVITETYSSGTSWYRVWSDGWIEQGGHIPQSSGTYGTITFLKSFSNTNYIVVSNTGNDAANNYFNVNTYTGKTTSRVSWYKSSNALAGDWQACGYISNYISSNDVIKY